MKHDSIEQNAIFLALSFLFVLLGIVMITSGQLLGWFVFGFFSLGILAFVFNMCFPKNPRSRLSQEQILELGRSIYDRPIPITNPDIEVYDFFVNEIHIARLYDPVWCDMFWCSYRLVPVSEETNTVLRKHEIWAKIEFIIRAKDGSVPNPYTFPGGNFEGFCRNETDRVSFRSLFPPKERAIQQKSRLAKLLDKIALFVRRLLRIGPVEDRESN